MDTIVQPNDADPFISIELKDAKQALNDFYYINGRQSIFSYKRTGRPMVASLIFAILSGYFYLLSFSNQVAWGVLSVFSALAFLVSLSIFAFRAMQYFQWNSKVVAYIDSLSKYETFTLRLHAQTFELYFDDESTIEKWTNIRKTSISPTRIQLNCESGSQYLFPARSMEPANYELLKKFVRDKMNNPGAVTENG